MNILQTTAKIHASRSRSCERRAFTLIELLVVISIVALLIALLLPALGQAHFVSNITQCASNQRQIHIGLFAFASDNDGRLPEGSAHPTGTAPGPGYIRTWPWNQPGSFPDVYHQGYVPDANTMFCPDGAWPGPNVGPTAGATSNPTRFELWNRMNIGYDIYANATDHMGHYEADEIPNTIDDPSQLVLLTDGSVFDSTLQLNLQYAHPGFAGDPGDGFFPPDPTTRVGLNVTRLGGSVQWHDEQNTELRYPRFGGSLIFWTKY